ncbi:cytochrome c oxidase assembly protein [Phenylobacterium sp.]|uniref:cytochrome c oxidase assembly protein n=1 Tax=Phenylobacterium sp. TaxID=1871053 RepID=UPI0035B4FA30
MPDLALAAYCGPPPRPAELLASWNLDAWVVGALAVAAGSYWLARRRAAGDDRMAAAAVAVLAVAFVTPLCALSSALFSARVAHHALLVVVAAPLFAAALPAGLLRGGLVATTLIQAAVFWFWHAPAPYAWALSGEAPYWLMEATLFASAVLFWAAVRRAHPLAASAALLVSMMQTGLLGALLTFAAQPLYAPHFAATAAWNLTPLEDQQLAGLTMWAPMALAYLLPALARVSRWLAAQDARGGAPA